MFNWWREKRFLQVQKDVRELSDKQRGKISDGYHTFDELYEHRVQLYILLCKEYYFSKEHKVWKSLLHSDGSKFEGWFVLGINTEPGKQITYHLPLDKWNECHFAEVVVQAPVFDGHSSKDVLNRLKKL